ncbi:type II secretion system minor pseudopilin GspK [Pusillimonas sp. CC-YST705]|uniref:Type II secretion system protein K n=2 Tax=Mesopusillimonas faecipullorum TaxID=2755040 RepID=A0ABS8CEB7_9BURK|nr:type II secretion system minor pseudopilin GspK [Mesopusillimonas faecipullorum]
MAVIVALLVVLAAAVVTTRIIEEQGLLARTLASERERAQAEWMLRGGMDWSRAILRFDAQTNATTRLDGIWAQPIVNLPVGSASNPEQALFTGQVEDELSKFNLRNLAQDGLIQPQALQELVRLFESLRIPAEVADNVAQRMAASQYGAESEPSAPGLQFVSDLAGVPGMTPVALATVSPFLTLLPSTTKVNVNTASAEVLAAVVPGMDLARARSVVLERDKGVWFNNVADFVNRLQLSGDEPGQRLAVQSQWFRVSGEIAGDQTLVAMQGLLYRADQEAAPTVRWISY